MALYAVHIANGTSSNTSLLRLFGRYLSGTGVVQPGAFTVSAQASPNMTVKVSGSAVLDDLFIRPTFGGTYHGWNTGTENVTIPSNATGITKIDHVVAYIDTAFSSGTADNPGALVLTTVRGTGTAAPSDAEINTALSSKPWIRLAEVTVANGASSINSGNITDLRAFATLDGTRLSGLPLNAIYLGSAQRTSTFSTSSSTSVQVTGLSAAVTVPSGGRKVKVTVFSDSVYASVASFIQISIWDGTVGSGTLVASATNATSSSGQQLSVFAQCILSPAAGAKTYNVGMSTSAGTATLVANSGSPAYILVELI